MGNLNETGKLLLNHGVSYYLKHHKRTTGTAIAKMIGKHPTEINRLFGSLDAFWKAVETECKKPQAKPQEQPHSNNRQEHLLSLESMAEIDSQWLESEIDYPELKYIDFSPDSEEQTLIAYAVIGDRYVFTAASTPFKWKYNTCNAIDDIIREILIAENVKLKKLPSISFYDFRTRIGWDEFMPGYYELHQIQLEVGGL